MAATTYQRVGGNGELGSLLFKYKLAKALTFVSLVAIVLMAIGSLVYPGGSIKQDYDDYTNNRSPGSSNLPTEEAVDYGGIKTTGKCELPRKITIAPSGDETYSPPPTDASLLKAISFVTKSEYEDYCQQWDPATGFTDAEPYNTRGECGTWQEKYTALHKHRLEQLELIKSGDLQGFTDSDRPTYISYVCKEVPANSNRGCGGLADRMSGMISTFFFALITDRAYLANWAEGNPIPLELLFDRPNVDWSFDPKEISNLFTGEKDSLLGMEQVDLLNQKYPGMGSIMFRDGPTQDFNALWNASYIEVRSNRGYIVRTFQMSSVYPERLESIGLTKENAFGCLADYMFRPTVGSRRFLNAYKQMFEMNSILSIGLQIRTDDNALANPQHDDNSLEKWNHFMICANQLASVHKQPHHKRVVYFLVTDSLKLRDEFVSMNEDPALAEKYIGTGHKDTTTVISGLPIEHIEPAQIAKYIDVEIPKEINRARMTPGVSSALMENWMLGYTNYRVISPQGYGKLAAFHSKSDNSTVAMPRFRQRDRAPDCTKPGALVKYDWLSTQWSLG
ncbi:hypothetical protein J3Q64DRAFT_1777345 [Phycomyces blakesleeanus]|uniref:Uncharacterized protein n=2 Tax=Phycomyces blakesleeanus TaxID=4837 RepID=A0A162XHS7_PHYB8|nr:hypothetical protein PHYBLDRAFT_186592 [Phycomyces blakesleeanus NRRL 1555(-)]OAD74965.1 hypothetical protein PHYBLDRAFT_186592 [Phycomyces blakesleeanus NRRL 1555(-)]|eukprot:XP_018293005.1 hypothetical protein PHYBLDRAFT_186592 [Phycomyces blakesleeanus NRRL 1555(-)]